MLRNTLLLCGSCLLLALTACSSGTGTGSTSIIPPVMAQTAYSNASLNGTYSMSWWSFFGGNDPNNGGYYSAVGTLQFNGSGTITGGTITLSNPGNFTCVESVSGTYSLQSTALGTATINLASTTKGCSATDVWQVSLAAGGDGTGIQMARTNQEIASGSAIKQ
jgi:hypothetical protein